MVKQKELPEGRKFFYFTIGVIETFLTIGIIFGWTPMLTILMNEGQYSEVCPGGIGGCQAQALKLNLIFTICVSAFGATFLFAGIFLDKVGPRASRLLGSAIFIVGLILFGASDSKKFDAFIPGYLLIGLGGPSIFSSFFHWSTLFQRKELYLTMLNCAFDGGAIVFFIFELIYFAGIKRAYIFYGYAILVSLIFIRSLAMKDPVPQETGRRRKRYAVEYMTDVKQAGKGVPKIQEDFYTFKEQLRSVYYIYALVCLVVVSNFINYYVGTVADQINAKHPSPHTQMIFRTLFNLVFPLGTILWVVPIGWMLSKFSIITSLFVGLSVGIIFGFVICVPSLYIQFLSFILLSLFRPLIYSTISTYVTVVFGFRRFGTLYGVMNIINGIFGLGQYLLNWLVYSAFDGDFFQVNFGMTFMTALMLSFPVFLKVKKRMNEMAGDNPYLLVQEKIEREISRNSIISYPINSTRSTLTSSIPMNIYGEDDDDNDNKYVPPPLVLPAAAPSSPNPNPNPNSNSNSIPAPSGNPFEAEDKEVKKETLPSSNPFDQDTRPVSSLNPFDAEVKQQSSSSSSSSSNPFDHSNMRKESRAPLLAKSDEIESDFEFVKD